MKASVDANLFRLVFGAASTDETRYYLGGVHIEPHPVIGAIMVATDGHRMIVAYDAEGMCEGRAIVRLKKDALVQCKLGKKETARRLIVDGDARTATIEVDGNAAMTAHDVIIDGVFPDWRRVIPTEERKAEKAMPTTFDPTYLQAFGALGHDIANTTGSDRGMRVALSDSTEPVIIRFGNPIIFGVLMPRRFGVEAGFLPDFMTDLQPAQLDAAE